MAEVEMLQWKDEYSTGVPEMDEQHKELINIINKLSEGLNSGEGSDYIGEVLLMLANYVLTHFESEEKFMQEIGFPKLEEHRKIHVKFAQDFLGFSDAYQEGETDISGELSEKLKDWLINHIAGADQEYGKFSKEKS